MIWARFLCLGKQIKHTKAHKRLKSSTKQQQTHKHSTTTKQNKNITNETNNNTCVVGMRTYVPSVMEIYKTAMIWARFLVRGEQTTNNEQQTTNSKQQTTNNKQQQTTNNKQQTTNKKQ